MSKKTEILFATNYSLSRLLICLMDLQRKINKPTGQILYAINKNKTKLISNSEEVESVRISLLSANCKLDDNKKPLMKMQGSFDGEGNEIETAVFKNKTSEKTFKKEYGELMNAENKDFKFFQIPLSKWLKVVMKEDEDEVIGLDYLFEYIIDEDK